MLVLLGKNRCLQAFILFIAVGGDNTEIDITKDDKFVGGVRGYFTETRLRGINAADGLDPMKCAFGVFFQDVEKSVWHGLSSGRVEHFNAVRIREKELAASLSVKVLR